jgi:phosphoglycolate phosphatase
MRFRAVLFDLDGTLLDTLHDIANAMNAALVELGAPLHAAGEYRAFVGQGLEILAEKVLPPNRRDGETVTRCVAAMRLEYGRIWARTTRPYEGIPELLGSLWNSGVKTAVLSNKADDFTKTMVSHFFGARRFEMVLGKSNDFPGKPDPSGALHIASRMGVRPHECVFVGDSDIDMQTARNAGMYPAGVLWGFRGAGELLASGAELLVSRPAEIVDKLFE